ncbi:MAG: ferric reductase-like transmembrane domain-containing protein [Kiritimatiellae bacterium]|nr:ferric reductase-like transmembrane domain-containing protein [Kiritimatiellia bacterium]
MMRWLILLFSQVLIIVGFWFWYHINHPMGNLLTGATFGQFLAWGRLAGLLAAFAILLQIILVGRVKWVERAFGLDRLTRLHHIIGFSLVVLLVAHPILVTAGHAMQAGSGMLAQWLDFFRNWEGVLAAAVGLAIMLAAILFSVAVVLKKLRYEIWYATHLSLYIAIALAFGHQLAVGSDLTDNRWFAAYWIALYVFTFGNLIFYRVIRPVWMFSRHRFAVERLVPEADDVTSVYINGRNLAAFPVEAGQFMLVRFLAPGFRWEEHPFSMSCRPDGRKIRLTIKRLGDFTRRIPDLKPGTPVIIDGPHGVFTARHGVASKILLIAGGIGITPIRSLAEELAAAGRNVVLLYANRNHQSLVFAKELDELEHAASGRLQVVPVMSDDPAWPGEKGRLDRDRIVRLVPDVVARDVYLCGPPPMMKAVRAILIGLDVPRAHIHYERFAL